MKKTYVFAAAIAALSGAAIEHYDNANASGAGVTRMPGLTGGMFPSRLGFRGSEDLGNGLAAIFTVENGFQPDTGNVNQGGRLFGRQAWVGLSGKWGALTIGRTYNMLYISTFDVDPFGRDVSAAGGPSAANCPGESATSAQACREYSGLLRYDAPGSAFGALVAYDKLRGGAGAAAGLTSADLSDSRLHLAGYANLGAWKFGAGVLHRNNEGSKTQPKSNLAYVDAAYSVTPQLVVDGQVAKLDFKDSPNDSAQVLLRAMYNFSKRTTVYVAAGHIVNDGTAAVALSSGGSVGAGLSQTGVITGIRHAF